MPICAPSEPQLLTNTKTSLNSPLAHDNDGIHNQRTKVCPDSNKAVGLLGFYDQYQHNDHNATTRQDGRDTAGGITPTQMCICANKDPGILVREGSGNKISCVHCSPTLSCTTESEDICTSCSIVLSLICSKFYLLSFTEFLKIFFY